MRGGGKHIVSKLQYGNLFVILVVIFTATPFLRALSYGQHTTHPALTSQIVDFYNFLYPERPILPHQRDWLIEGSILEDTKPRPLNHLYDPVRDISWNGENVGNMDPQVVMAVAKSLGAPHEPLKAIDWVNNYQVQSQYKNYGGNRTWVEALRYWTEDNEKEAFITLGHILHLVEDMGVPDHTRNDAHPPFLGGITNDTGSPYENFAKRYNVYNIERETGVVKLLKESGKTPPVYLSIEDYLKSLAEYSNKYFFSKDTIYDAHYNSPKVVRSDGNFAYGIDEEGKEFPLARAKFEQSGDSFSSFYYLNNPEDEEIFQAYFERLSKQIILHGAGVMNLFFEQARDAEVKKDFPSRITRFDASRIPGSSIFTNTFSIAGEAEKLINKVGPLISTVKGFIKNATDEFTSLVGDTFGMGSGFKRVTEISLVDESGNSDGFGNTGQDKRVSSTPDDGKTIPFCGFDASAEPMLTTLIINEVAWMGTNAGSDKEWVELKNLTSSRLDISGYQLVDKKEQIKVVLPSGTFIPPRGLFLLERSDDSSAPGVKADFIYEGALSNKDEGLRLFDNNCNLLDEVFANPSWPAGDNNSKKTMERSPDFEWYTSVKSGGTPRTENSSGEKEATPIVWLDKNVVERGGIIQKGGKGFYPGGKVLLHFILPEGQEATDLINADKDGNFLKIYTMPVEAALGDYKYYAEDLTTGAISAEITYSVVEKTTLPFLFGRNDKKTGDNQNKPPADSGNEIEETAIAKCVFNTNQIPARNSVILNEVAWMGTSFSASDEWIELKNISNRSVNLNGYQLIDKGEQIYVIFGNAQIPSGGLYLLERTDDNSVPRVPADLIYKGSLANEDEGLRLFDNSCRLLDEVFASPSWPAGSNSSKGTMERTDSLEWQTSAVQNGTPRQQNSKPVPSVSGTPTGGGANSGSQIVSLQNENTSGGEESTNPTQQEQSSATSISGAAGGAALNVVISEIMPGVGTGLSDAEFVELYNPTDKRVDLTGWSLGRRATLTSTSVVTLVESFGASVIEPKGFFLIASPEYSGKVSPNEIYSSPSRLAYADDAVLLYDAEGNLVDEVVYSNIDRGSSWERYAYKNGECFPAQGSYEFDGNGCAESLFSLRSVPNPQNTLSFPEPRANPTASAEPFISYNPDNLTISFNWSPYKDYTDSSEGIYYEIKEYNSPGVVIYSSSSLGFSKRIDEVGRSYKFSFQAFDKDGLGSKVTTSTVEVPSLFDSLYFYKNPQDASQPYLIDFTYSKYPFVPDIFGRGEAWKGVVFYLNREAPKFYSLETGNDFTPDETGVLLTNYKRCGGYQKAGAALLMADSADRCEAFGGGVGQLSVYPSGFLEDNHFLVQTASSGDELGLTSDDFITAAFYAFSDSGGGSQRLRFVAADKTKYYLQSRSPQKSPVFGGLSVNFDKSNSALVLNWPPATDPDSPDNTITYEVNLSPPPSFLTENWSDVGTANGFSKIVSFGDEFLIGVRAKDDFGNLSEVATATWKYPPVEVLINQDSLGSWSDAWGYVIRNVLEPDAASFQSFVPEKDFVFNKVAVRLKQESGADSSIRLSVYSDGGSGPDFSNKLGESISPRLIRPDFNTDFVFSFDTPLSVREGRKYWLVLDVQSVGWNGKSYFDNKWRNAVVGGDAYTGGEAGKGLGWGFYGRTDCSGCGYSGAYSSGPADWYFKIFYVP